MLKVIQMGCIGALAGLITNILAIESLFHPYKPSIFLFGFQGFLIRNKKLFLERTKEILQIKPSEIEEFLVIHKKEVPFLVRFLASTVSFDKFSKISELFIESKFSMTDKEFEGFCKSYAGGEIRFVKFMGIIVGFFEVIKKGGEKMKIILMTTGLIFLLIIISYVIDRVRSRDAREKRRKDFIKKKLQDPEPHSVFWCAPDINPLNNITEDGLWIPDHEMFIPESFMNKLKGVEKSTKYYGDTVSWLKAGNTFFDNKLKSVEDGLLINDSLFITASEIKRLRKVQHLIIGEK